MQEITPEISEIAGVFAADGSMQEKHICFWGNPIEDKEYYDNVLGELFKKAFGIEIRLHEKKSNGVYGFYVCKKHVLDYFKNELGFKPGPKTYTVQVPKIILESNDLKIQKAFVQGFMSADGCLTFYKRGGTASNFNKKYNVCPRIMLSSVSEKIILQLQEILNKIEINSFIMKAKSANPKWKDNIILYVNGTERVKRWNELIGFSNPKDKTKFEIFKQFGFCPLKTSIFQRYKILNNELSIYDFYQGP
ncbi:MAG: LAGLIDADG family homing endonuclease [Candidatus Diapherotrites archaeon]|nr:LAGLIDADG family homing endonuclease [Candidatus Diapherotrites archaeon]